MRLIFKSILLSFLLIPTNHLFGSNLQAKYLVQEFYQKLDSAEPDQVLEVLQEYHRDEHEWYGVYPFREMSDHQEISDRFWSPLKTSFRSMKRSVDILIGGENEIESGTWVMSMGHLFGNFSKSWLGIPATGKMMNIRYAAFHRVEDGKIISTGMFFDLLGVIEDAGIKVISEQTGNFFRYPGPMNHDGIQLVENDPKESQGTLALVNSMVDDLSQLNNSGSMGCPPELLEKSWHKDMEWYGPCGIGASFTIPGYQKQHQLPFRSQLTNKKFLGHKCRFADGNFACFFGWPNLTNRNAGGFLGLPANNIDAEMQVVDVYYRDPKSRKLLQNWVFIDLPYWMLQQGKDVLKMVQRKHLLLNENDED